MDDCDQEQFKNLLHDKYSNNLNRVNEVLVKHIELIERKKRANKSAYQKNKDNEEFMKKKKDYDKQYYTEHKHELLNNRKDKYHNDNEYREQIRQRQKDKYDELKQLKQSINYSESSHTQIP